MDPFKKQCVIFGPNIPAGHDVRQLFDWCHPLDPANKLATRKTSIPLLQKYHHIFFYISVTYPPEKTPSPRSKQLGLQERIEEQAHLLEAVYLI